MKTVNWANNMKMTLMVKEVPAILRKLSGTNSNRNVMGPCLL